MKKIKIAFVAAGVLLLAGCGCQNKAPQDNLNNSTVTAKPEEKSVASNVISSIKDAMLLGKTMKCTYLVKGENGSDLTYTTYVNGKKYKNEMSVGGAIQHVVFDEEAMYSWQEGQKQGMKMTMACSKELAASAPQSSDNASQAPDPTGEKTFDNAVDVECENASSTDFSVPSDVTFSDQCEMLKNIMNSIPGGASIPSNLPANIPIGR